jgi:hypothetical protein
VGFFSQRSYFTMHKAEYVLAGIMLIACFFIVPWSYNNWMAKTGPHATTTNQVNQAPTLSASQADTILCAAKSPACGTGSALYTYSAEYNVDDAFALAVFKRESSYGELGVATQTHSLGNLRCIPDAACEGGYAAFPSWQEGYSAFYKLIAGPLYVGAGLTTPDQIMPKYAPAGDGNLPASYATAVDQDMALWKQS